MRFRTQQLIALAAAFVLLTAVWTGFIPPRHGPVDTLEMTGELLDLQHVGVFLLWAVFARWVLRVVWFNNAGAPWLNRIGLTPHGAFRDTFSARFNRWFFHVDENGIDRDLNR